MQLFQKTHYIARCSCPDVTWVEERVDKDSLTSLFDMLDRNDIEYRPLDIPLIDLDLDNYIPKENFQDVVLSSEFQKLIDRSIRFDFYLPEFGYVFCLSRSKGGISYRHVNETKSCLENLVEQLIGEARRPVSLVDAYDMHNTQSIFSNAVMSKLRSMGIRSLFDSGFDIYDDHKNAVSDFGPVAIDKIATLERGLLGERNNR